MVPIPCLLVFALILVSQITAQFTSSDQVPRVTCHQPPGSTESIYDFKYSDLHKKKEVKLDRFTGKVVLIVNVATYCDYTWQYHGLNALQAKFKNDGFRILAFPCNQFGKEQPGANGTEIMNGIKYVRPGGGFEPIFPHMETIDVNGAKEASLYTYLKKYCPTTFMQYAKDIHYKPMRVGDIYWNWEKFLIGREGRVVGRYHSSLDPLDAELVKDILYQLKKKHHQSWQPHQPSW